jgi:uncharacterized protein YbaR (Trm112 family)
VPLNPQLLEILRCPVCRLECAGCHRVYPIVDGIPVMLAEEARPARP